MPSRMIREGLIASDAVNALTAGAEVLFVRLILIADDYGRHDARPSILRAKLFPLKLDTVSDADVSAWLDECRRAGLVRVYAVGGKPFLEIPKFGQRMRAKVSKCPPPPDACPTGDGHPPGGCPADDGHVPDTWRPESESESESESEETPSESGPEPDEPAAGPTVKLAKRSTKPRKEPTGPHADARHAFCAGWQAKYGEAYAFKHERHGTHLKWMLEQVNGDLLKLQGIFDRFLADDHRFYAADSRHSFDSLFNNFPRWLVASPLPNTRPPPRSAADCLDSAPRTRT